MSDLPEIVRLLLALAIVISLMGGLAYILKKLGLSGAEPVTQKNKRLRLLESLPLDTRHRLVIVECDKTQHLLLLGAQQDTLIQSDIGHPKDA